MLRLTRLLQLPPASRDAALAGGLAAAGYAAAAFNLAALSWDGSWYLFRSLQDRAPFIPHGRYATYPILWVLVRAARICSDPRALGVGYGFMLALFPLVALGVSWAYLRGEQRAPLRIWPTLGILLAPLPGQLCLLSEATLAAQLLWPVLAILTAGPPGLAGSFWLAGLSAALWFLHPTAAVVFGLAAACCAGQAWGSQPPGSRRGDWRRAAAFAALAVGKVLVTFFSVTEYERIQMSGGEVLAQLAASLAGWPLVLLLLTYLLGALVRLEAAAVHPRLGRGAAWAVCVLMMGAGLLWVRDPVRWQGLLDYRRFVLPAVLPLIVLAARHRRILARAPAATDARTPASASANILPPMPTARWTLTVAAAVFALVLSAQSLVWRNLIERFADSLAQHADSRGRFVAADELPFTHGTVLRHWTAAPLSILLQGRRPATVFVLRREDVQAGGVRVNPWEQILFADGWFQLAQFAGEASARQVRTADGHTE